MTREKLLSNIWVRALIFAWMIVFPIVFIALPMVEVLFGRAEQSWTPVWGLIVWMLGPWAASILMKNFGQDQASSEDKRENENARN